jgi:hypothetical protein
MTKEYKILKNIDIQSLAEASACKEELSKFIKIHGYSVFTTNFSNVGNVDVLKDNLDWLEDHGFIEKVQENVRIGDTVHSINGNDYLVIKLTSRKGTLLNIETYHAWDVSFGGKTFPIEPDSDIVSLETLEEIYSELTVKENDKSLSYH